MRTYDKTLVKAAIGDYADEIRGLNLDEWLAHPKNVALTNVDGDVALFESQWALPGTVCGHYFFISRGKEARKTAIEMLEEIFTGPYDVQTIVGLTPLDNEGALWMNRQLGFQDNGTIETAIGPCRFSMLTIDQWRDRQKGSQNE